MKIPIWKNNKTGNLYVVEGTTTNATNAQDGQKMVKYYSLDDNEPYVREISEFKEKFTFVEHRELAP